MKLQTGFLLAVWLGPRAFAADEVTPLLDKMAAAYGGSQRLEAVSTVRQTGKVEAATSIGRSGRLLRVFTRPRKLRVEVGQGGEVRVLDGTRAWRDSKEVSGPAAQAMVLQAVRLDLPWQLLANRNKLVEHESQEFHGKRVRMLLLPLDQNLSVAAGIDPATGRILHTVGSASGGPMGVMRFETEYDDFRTADGVLFAFKETNLANGTKTADIALTKVEVLRTPPEDAFKP
jgi:hypothetical protein